MARIALNCPFHLYPIPAFRIFPLHFFSSTTFMRFIGQNKIEFNKLSTDLQINIEYYGYSPKNTSHNTTRCILTLKYRMRENEYVCVCSRSCMNANVCMCSRLCVSVAENVRWASSGKMLVLWDRDGMLPAPRIRRKGCILLPTTKLIYGSPPSNNAHCSLRSTPV